MSHTFLALHMALIPVETKNNVPNFSSGYFSNDMSRMLVDGYNSSRELVHPQATLDAWLQWEVSPLESQHLIISSAEEYTAEQFAAMRNNADSIWYVEEIDP